MKVHLALAFSAMLVSPTLARVSLSGLDVAPSPIVPVRDGCGPGFHMNDYGRCLPNFREREREERRFERRKRLVCPPGYHLGDGGRACFQNR